MVQADAHMNHDAIEDERLVTLADLLTTCETQDNRTARVSAIGLVETLLHFTAEYAPDGDLSGFSAKSIAGAMDWEGDADFLLHAFREAGYLTQANNFENWELLSEWSDA